MLFSHFSAVSFVLLFRILLNADNCPSSLLYVSKVSLFQGCELIVQMGPQVYYIRMYFRMGSAKSQNGTEQEWNRMGCASRVKSFLKILHCFQQSNSNWNCANFFCLQAFEVSIKYPPEEYHVKVNSVVFIFLRCQVMEDTPRLVKRSQLKRSQYKILGKSPGSCDLSHDAHLRDYEEEIFDDDDFYHQVRHTMAY